jgi:hypothetical protein
MVGGVENSRIGAETGISTLDYIEGIGWVDDYLPDADPSVF